MTRSLSGSLAICMIFVIVGSAKADESEPFQVKSDRSAKNSVYAELGGNGGLYSVNYERFVIDDVTARIGLMYMQLGATATSGPATATANVSWFAAPLMVSYLGIGGLNHKLELGAGAVVMYFSGGVSTFSATTRASGTVIAPSATVGYRYAPTDGGFNFKVGFTPLLISVAGQTSFLPWAGISGGYGF